MSKTYIWRVRVEFSGTYSDSDIAVEVTEMTGLVEGTTVHDATAQAFKMCRRAGVRRVLLVQCLGRLGCMETSTR